MSKKSQMTPAKLFLCFAFLSFLFLSSRTNVSAFRQGLESDNYKILFPNFNSGAGIPSSSNYKLNSTLGQLAPGLFESTNYKVRSGFQYINTIIPFSLTISDITIEFPTLSPQTAYTQNATLTVKAGGAGGYSVKASEDRPLSLYNLSAFIPDTNCDSTCSNSSAGVWSSTSAYGFGYNMQGDDIPGDFSDTTYFRPFANAASLEDPQIIMEKAGVTWDYPDNQWPWESSATITYKIVISATQEAGSYKNIINFIAIPAF